MTLNLYEVAEYERSLTVRDGDVLVREGNTVRAIDFGGVMRDECQLTVRRVQMKAYCLGFAFDDVGRVVLIRKNKPEWQAGRWNGVGGLIESGETPQVAMAREFEEETGVKVAPALWTKIGAMIGNAEWYVHVYTHESVAIRDCRTTTQEEVSHFVPWKLPENMIENLPAMISLAQIDEKARPEFFLTYK